MKQVSFFGLLVLLLCASTQYSLFAGGTLNNPTEADLRAALAGGGTMHVIVAGTNGVSYRLLSSGDLKQWSPVATNTIGSDNYWEMYLPIGTAGAQFYRAVTP